MNHIPVRKNARGVRNIAEMIADSVRPFIGTAVQGEDCYEPTVRFALYAPALPDPCIEARVIEQLELFPAA